MWDIEAWGVCRSRLEVVCDSWLWYVVLGSSRASSDLDRVTNISLDKSSHFGWFPGDS